MARLRGQEKQSDDEYLENFARLLNIFDRATKSDQKNPQETDKTSLQQF